MKDIVLVEFYVEGNDVQTLCDKLYALGPDIEIIKSSLEYEDEDGIYSEAGFRISAKASSAFLTVVKLQDPYLAERMRISYIPEELKDKYRTGRYSSP